MKRKDVFMIVFLSATALLVMSFQYTLAAKDKVIAPPKVGIVSIKEIFEKCSMKDAVEKNLAAEGEKKFNELKSLEESLEADKEALGKRKQGSEDYMELLKATMLKQSSLEAKKEYYQQELTLQEMQGKEEIYRKVLQVIATVAKEKGLDMVISRDDNYLNMPESSAPAQTPTDLILTTRTHKLLYFNPDLDITFEVLDTMDKSIK